MEQGQLRLLSSRFDLQDVVRRPGEIQLVGDVIDHQLLDMHGVVVRRGPVQQTLRVELDAKAAAVLARATDPALRAVLDLHRPVIETSGAWPVCQGCDSDDGPDAEPPEWPCRTWTLIQQRLNP